jgi:hypothetical protein
MYRYLVQPHASSVGITDDLVHRHDREAVGDQLADLPYYRAVGGPA